MDTIKRETLSSLARPLGWPSVSLYLTTHRGPAENEQDRIRLKNLLDSATSRLMAGGMRAPDATDLLGETTQLLKDPSFWRRTADGVAVFIAPNISMVYVVDTPLPDEVIVGDRFHIRPLALAYHGEQRFAALVLDRNATRLYVGDRSRIRELAITGGPTSFSESTKFDQREESLQYSTHASPASVAGAGRTIGTFHGHGGQNVDKTELARFMSELDKAVMKTLSAEGPLPLLLLGVDYQVAAYRATNTNSNLVDERVLGATDELTAHEIHELAFNALAPRFAATVETDLTELHEQSGSLVSEDPVEIVSAAASGRVKTLFFDEAKGPFGHFDRDAFTVDSACASEPRLMRDQPDTEVIPDACGWDLVDLAIAETILHGGDIHAFSGETPPVHGVAAVMRY